MIAKLKKVASNKVMNYIFSRYFTYIIQFINSLIIAVALGPFYLGVWGFINLTIQYFNQINFGISYSLNAIIAVKKEDEDYVEKIFSNSLTLTVILCVIVLILYFAVNLFHIQIGNKYQFNKYYFLVSIIAILNYLMSLFSNVYRVYGKIFEIAFSQSALPIAILVTLVLFRNSDLIVALVYANLLAFFLSVALYIKNSPLKLVLNFNKGISAFIIKKAFHLFLYNASFYLIIITTRSFISAYYDVISFGYFTFSFSLANVIILLFDSFSFLIFPKILNKFSKAKDSDAVNFLSRIRTAYITLSHFVVHFVILLFPVFLLFFPKYTPSLLCFRIVVLTLVLFSNSFGYQGLLIAKGKEAQLGLIALFSLLVNVIIAFLISKVFHLDFYYVVFATTISYYAYSFVVGYFGRKMLNCYDGIIDTMLDIFPVKLFLPFLMSLIFIFLGLNNLFFILPLLLFLILNYKEYKIIISIIKDILNKPSIIDI